MGSARHIIVAEGQDLAGVDEALASPAGRIGSFSDAVTGDLIPGPAKRGTASVSNYAALLLAYSLRQLVISAGLEDRARGSERTLQCEGPSAGRYR